MPKKTKQETQEEQSERFRAEAERMIAAGELSPTDAEDQLERVLKAQTQKRRPMGGAWASG